ncbi:FixH family protein [Ferruginibacter sp.]
MNWGYKIFTVYGVFVAGISFMVFKSSSQQMDLVTTDYYAKELKYQEKIDEAERTAGLSGSISYQVNNNELQVVFPKDFQSNKVTGTITLYCPADEHRDQQKDFTVQDQPAVLLLAGTAKGQYELQVQCVVNNKSYYFKKRIFIE